MVLEIEPSVQRIHTSAQIRILQIYAAIPGQTIIGPVLQVLLIQYLGINGNKKSDSLHDNANRTSWAVMCRRKNRYVEEVHLNDTGHNPTSSELLLERSVAKESEPCSTEMEQSSIEETLAT